MSKFSVAYLILSSQNAVYSLFFWVLNDLQILGLDVCADTLVGDPARRGISGGQKKRLTTGIVCTH